MTPNMPSSGRVDVLSTILRHAESHRAMAETDAYSAQEAPLLEAAYSAVADLIEACKARDLAEGLAIQAEIENGYGLCPEKARAAHIALTDANLRYYAALAALTEPQS